MHEVVHCVVLHSGACRFLLPFASSVLRQPGFSFVLHREIVAGRIYRRPVRKSFVTLVWEAWHIWCHTWGMELERKQEMSKSLQITRQGSQKEEEKDRTVSFKGFDRCWTSTFIKVLLVCWVPAASVSLLWLIWRERQQNDRMIWFVRKETRNLHGCEITFRAILFAYHKNLSLVEPNGNMPLSGKKIKLMLKWLLLQKLRHLHYRLILCPEAKTVS